MFRRTINKQLLAHDALHLLAQTIPYNKAIVFHGPDFKHILDYKELDRQSTKLANYLRIHHSDKQKIGISISRSPNLIISIFAALKAGLTIIPMETDNYPSLPIKEQLADIILTDKNTIALFTNSETINIDAIDFTILSNEYTQTKVTTDDPAYIIYTSGTSSGVPKAVMLPHSALSNLLEGLNAQHIQKNSKVLCTALPTFDAFYFDLLVAIATQGEIHICPENERYDTTKLNTMITDQKINFAALLPNVLNTLDPNLPLQHIISMGAAPHIETLNAWYTANPGRRIENGLGHTETGICLSLHQYQPGDDPRNVGKPIANMEIDILNDDTYTRVKTGETGEIFVSGPGLAKEYMNQPELTAKSFITIDRKRMYATGDYGCIIDGELQFQGRKDRQIKKYGVRIELASIESELRNSPLIKDIAIIPQGQKQDLIAHIVANKCFTPANLLAECDRIYTEKGLPKIALPVEYTELAELPLTRNAKVAKDELAKIVTTPLTRAVVKPMGEIEPQMLELWSKVLGRHKEQISTTESFTVLGGNSQSAGQLAGLIRIAFPKLRSQLDIFQLFNVDMTIQQLSAEILRETKKCIISHGQLSMFSNRTKTPIIGNFKPRATPPL